MAYARHSAATDRMWTGYEDIEWDPSRYKTMPAICDELDVAKRPVKTSAPAGLPSAKCAAQSVCARGDLGTELKCVQTIVVAGNAHGRYSKPSKGSRDAQPTDLRVASQITDEQNQVVSAFVEESDVLVVPEEMHITNHGNSRRLRGTVVHGTKVSRRREACEQEETVR